MNCSLRFFQTSIQLSKVENSQFVSLLRVLGSSGDLEQNVAAIFHRRCGPGKFVSTLKVEKNACWFFLFFKIESRRLDRYSWFLSNARTLQSVS